MITHCDECFSDDLFFAKDGRVLCCYCGADLTPPDADLTFLPLPDEAGPLSCYDCGITLDALTVRYSRNTGTAHCVPCSELE